jgi:hypothetical protein
MNSIDKVIESLDKKFWVDLAQSSLSRSRKLAQMRWYHYKIYVRVKQFNANELQTVITKSGEVQEIPNERELFYKTHARFSLVDYPVTYLSNEHSTSWEEVIKDFRYNEYLDYQKDILPYFEGKYDPTPDGMLHYIQIKISDESIILDLTRNSNLLVQKFEKNWTGNKNFYDSIIYSRYEEIYPETQKIAVEAFHNGFDGIVYRSVRTETGARHPELNLVMFPKSKLIRK